MNLEFGEKKVVKSYDNEGAIRGHRTNRLNFEY